MRVGKKSFPYPVLNSDKSYSTYDDVVFKLSDDIKIEHTDNFIIKNVSYELNDKFLKFLIKKGLIEVYLVVECSYTIYRKEFLITETPQDIEIDINNLNNIVVISSFGVAKTSISNYHSENFNEFYKDINFNIEKNNIVLVDDGFRIKVEYDESEDNKISSIFSIIKKVNDDSNMIAVDATQNKINITLGEKQFEKYETLSKHPQTHPVFFSILLIPALFQELTKIQNIVLNENNGITEIEDLTESFTWFRSVVNRYKELEETKLDLDDFEEMSMLQLAQKLLNFPIIASIDNIAELYFNKGDDLDDE